MVLRLEAYQINLTVIGQAFAQYGYRITDRQGVLYVCDGSDGSPQSGKPSSIAPAPVPVQPRKIYPVVFKDDTGGVFAGLQGWGGSHAVLASSQPNLAPLESSQLTPVRKALVSYRTDYVSPQTLLEVAQPVFADVEFSVVSGEGQRPAIFASGAVETVERFEKMVKWLDREPEAVEVQAIVLEVSDGLRSGFGVSMVLETLKSGLGFSIGSSTESNQLTFRSGSFDAVLSAVTGSTNVLVVSSPRLRGRSGEKMQLQVGSGVPTLGAVRLTAWITQICCDLVGRGWGI